MSPYIEPDIVPDGWGFNDTIIKVVGVGGGGCNAVNYMYSLGIQGCSFIVCNTNASSLAQYDVPTKIQLGDSGLGAGTDPTVGRNAALESQEEITRLVLDNGTKMLFITAGMGGGTGTGAAPVIARLAKDRGILTVGVVTIPFRNEGSDAISKAIEGIRELEKNTDALLLVDNQKLYECFGDTLTYEAFPKADEVLATAVRGIIEVINFSGYIDVDFQDVTNILQDAGMALMGSGEGTGENRLEQAVKGTFESPLLNHCDLSTAKSVLLNITSGKNQQGLKMSDLEKLDELINHYVGKAKHFKKGIVWDESPDFGDKVRITAIVTGFDVDLSGLDGPNSDNIVVIDDNFVWEAEPDGKKILHPEAPKKTKIDYKSNHKKVHNFATEVKPDLCVEPGQRRSELENVSAIRRKG